MHGDGLFKIAKSISYVEIDFISSQGRYDFLISQSVDSLTSYLWNRCVDIVRIHVGLF
jgi:hypothetical protein